MIESKLIHCEPDNPNRCQCVGDKGQCPFLAVENCKFCSRHGANSQIEAQEKKSVRNYRLQKWQTRLDEFSEATGIKSLRDEIGILRIMMEEIINRCSDAHDLFIHSGQISDLAVKIEKLVSSCHRLESSTGQLLDKSAALSFAAQCVEIIGTELNLHVEPDKVELVTDSVSSKILDMVKTLK